MSLRDELLPGEGTNYHLDASTTVVRNKLLRAADHVWTLASESEYS